MATVANTESRKYKGKRLTERTLKPNSMYQTEVAHIADVWGRVLINAQIAAPRFSGPAQVCPKNSN